MAKKQALPAETIPGLSDAHTHLTSIGAPFSELMDRAATAGVTKLCTVGDGLAEAEAALVAAHQDDRVYAACAIHPTRAGELDAPTRERLRELVADPRCVAVGETGIDTYWISHDPERTAPLEVQEEALRWHIDLACATGKALMIHNREGDAELLRILADAPTPRETILHCFSSPLDVAYEAIARGFVLSFAGNITFKRNTQLREIVALTPPGQLLIETDAPYLTPEPYRGARNEPALIGHTAHCVAECRGVGVNKLAEELGETFDRVYGLK